MCFKNTDLFYLFSSRWGSLDCSLDMWSRHLVLNRAYTSGWDGTCWLFIPNRAGWDCKHKPWRVHYLLKGRAGEANMLLEKPQRSFSHKLAQECVPYPPQCPVKARSLPTIHRASQKILMVMDGAVYFSLLREGLTITECSDNRLAQGWAESHYWWYRCEYHHSTPSSAHTSACAGQLYVSKWSGVWASGQEGAFLLRRADSEDDTRNGVKGVQAVSI